MAILTLRDTTLPEVEKFFQINALPLSKKVTISFDYGDTINNQKNDTDNQPDFYDFANSEVFGMWADREEMADSVEYIKKLRREQWG